MCSFVHFGHVFRDDPFLAAPREFTPKSLLMNRFPKCSFTYQLKRSHPFEKLHSRCSRPSLCPFLSPRAASNSFPLIPAISLFEKGRPRKGPLFLFLPVLYTRGSR